VASSDRQRCGPVAAYPADGPDPDDPIEILLALPQEYHAEFRVEYAAAVDGARCPDKFRQLQEMLRMWRLRAVAYACPGYAERMAQAGG
jgi:hypothetical protein